MDNYSVVYIDDKPEAALTKYLDREFHSEDYQIDCSEIIFKPEEGYESLLSDPKVSAANIILIDSWLFENKTATGGKFTGEEFKLVLKKFYPFIEVIVITQNGTDTEIYKVAKYDKACGQTASDYYAHTLPPVLDEAVKNIRQYHLLASIVSRNESWETVLKEKVLNTLQGINTYDDFTKTDIDSLVSAFIKIQESLNG